MLDETREALADRGPHAAAEEAEVEDADRDPVASDTRGAGEDRLATTRRPTRRREPLHVRATIHEAERIRGTHLGRRPDEAAHRRRDARGARSAGRRETAAPGAWSPSAPGTPDSAPPRVRRRSTRWPSAADLLSRAGGGSGAQ